VSRLREPAIEKRRSAELAAELVARARAWLPSWRPSDDGDFGVAMLTIAARLEAAVTERFAKVPAKTYRGFLAWLGVRGLPARAAEIPVVFTLAAGSAPVLVEPPVQLQATPPASGTAGSAQPITFETQTSVQIVPGSLATLVGVDVAADAYYLPPAGFSALRAPEPGPTAWEVTTDANGGATELQLQPEQGLDALPTLLHEPSNREYRVTSAKAGLVTIDPPVGTPEPPPNAPPATGSLPGLATDQPLRAVTRFAPFGGTSRDRQYHALYVGSESLLNLPTAGQIRIDAVGLGDDGASWSYWGKAGTAGAVGWQPVTAKFVRDHLEITKDAGSVEVATIDGRKSRWLRALLVKAAGAAPSTVSNLALMVNCQSGATPPPCPLEPGDKASPVAIEAVANTTPLVLGTTFYPLGREPRLFDAFYLGCAEALSKPGASVSICFQAPNGAAAALLAATAGTGGRAVLFGIGADGNLQRLAARPGAAADFVRLPAVRPPFSENGTMAVAAPPMALNVKQEPRLTAVTRSHDAVVAVSAGPEAWLWSESIDGAKSRWFRVGPVVDSTATSPAAFDPAHPPEVVVVRHGDGLHLFGLVNGDLLEADLDGRWDGRTFPAWTKVAASPLEGRRWHHIAPVFDVSAPRTGASYGDGLVAVDAEGIARYEPTARVRWTAVSALGRVLADRAPLAVKRAGGDVLIVAQKDGDTVAAWHAGAARPLTVKSSAVNAEFDWTPSPHDEIAVVFARRAGANAHELATWHPLADASGTADPKTVYTDRSDHIAGGAPAVGPSAIVATGANGEIQVAPFDAGALVPGSVTSARIDDVLVAHRAAVTLEKDEFFVTTEGKARRVFRVAEVPTPIDSDTVMYVPTPDRLGPIDPSVTMFKRRIAADKPGKGRTGNSIVPDSADPDTALGETIVVTLAATPARPSVHQVVAVTPTTGSATSFTVTPDLPDVGPLSYVHVQDGIDETAAAHPRLDLTGQPAAILDAIKTRDIYMHGASPVRQAVTRFVPDATAPTHALLADAWKRHPHGGAGGTRSFVVNALYGPLSTSSDPAPPAPNLSWEYWDGSAWWTIPRLTDTTGSLLQTGVVAFCVPAGLQQTDVAGRKGFWIRARLVGGDYGQATVTIKTSPPDAHGNTTQTVDRSLASVKPPQIVSMNLTYSVCCPTLPDYVLTEDAAAFRDQSAVNATGGATVEYFTPLAVTIKRATGALPTSSAPADGAVSGQATDDGHALYLGFDGVLEGGPISVLFLAEDTPEIGAYPLQVDALRENRFDRLSAVDDGTRGLSETGVLSFAVEAAVPETELFGQGRRWIRIRPNPAKSRDWTPSILGAYLNATFAKAQATQRLERLGSSDGSPKQTVTLARPPVLAQTLELRILEPLDDIESSQLTAADPNAVLQTLAGRDGAWVLWTEVDDTDDAAAGARVYALDPDTGSITFGDGRHGRIPPIGRDSIVAVAYKRGGGAAANAVQAWAQLSLITPIRGVQGVSAPDGAAGGSDAQTIDEVLRFAPDDLFMRKRVLTLHDLESQAIQFSRDIAQARAVPGGASVTLVVVMKGREPRPSNAVVRVLRDYLSRLCPPELTAPGVLTIVQPTLVPVRVSLTLAVDSASATGSVAEGASRRVAALLDPAAGGLDGLGWPLGAIPVDTDVAAALDGVAHLEDVAGVTLQSVTPEGASAPMPTALGARDLVVLAPDGLSIDFTITPVEVGG
jgi:hypothetical protein